MVNAAINAVVDSHCHIDLPAFEQDRGSVLEDAVKAGVKRVHVPGTTEQRWQGLLQLQQNAHIDISLGLHPYFLQDVGSNVLAQSLINLEVLVKDNLKSVVAIGECGLDGAVSIPMELQQTVFESQIDIATVVKKPLIVHGHKAHHLVHQSLGKKRFTGGGIIHAFSGSEPLAQQYIDRGFLLGIGGTITYPRAKKTVATVCSVGLEHIVLETDSPDMPLNGFQGQRNTPDKVNRVASVVADLLGTSIDAVKQRTTENYLRLFA